MKKILIHLRTSIKLISVTALAIFLILGVVALIYKPTYSVSLGGEFIGYTNNKSELQTKINEYIENGEEEHTAFVQVENMPEYKLCLLKKDIQANDDEIFSKVKQTGTAYYRYYAILQDGEEKLYVASFEEAENALNGLKEKQSANQDKITIVEKYEKEMKDFVTTEEVISKLYEKKQTKTETTVAKNSGGSVKAASGVNTSGKKVALGIDLIKPISGTVTSRFGSRWGKSHKGIDIGAAKGTKIKAVAGGTVTTRAADRKGGRKP